MGGGGSQSQQQKVKNSEDADARSPRGSGEFQEAPLLMTDFDFFEEELNRYQESLTESLMERRCGMMNGDPMEELSEVYSEVAIMESDFKKALGIFNHLLGHSRGLFHKNREMNVELDKIHHENQMMQHSSQG